MAGDAEFSFSTTCMTLFFSLLLACHIVMAFSEHSLSPLTFTEDGAKKSNTMVATSAREDCSQKSKRDMTPNENIKEIHVPDQPQQGPKRGKLRAPRSQLQWRKNIFNASEHEVPSGPNPISNR
ncbi:PREDICTED: CLAVATA3/ESR (CLE)-related protein TDIF-like [Lupinus angustifolius]|uniref:CLAVATA3/ESR (CLE)-related protein TDIF-like n=1 Tax=Lupinus angustifolius TaxID=3871 RepID=UPI00092F8171|nr:PREDICTED: CLAVATA3/ESR (CLE)-related protein TDIF-like [Lupinus angustifolius]